MRKMLFVPTCFITRLGFYEEGQILMGCVCKLREPESWGLVPGRTLPVWMAHAWASLF